MKSRKLLTFLALVILIVPVLTACGPTKIDVGLTTYKITMSKTSASSGDIVFHVHNDATDLTHEFVIFKTDLPADQLPLTAEALLTRKVLELPTLTKWK